MVGIQPYTGSSGTLLFDDKGSVLKLCLGLPHDSHVDDALRAVSAGLAVERDLKRLGLRCAIGIAAGRGVCMPRWRTGEAALRRRRPLHACRRTPHATRRRGVLCTNEIADRVRGEFTLSPEGRVDSKGVRGPLRPFRVRDMPRHAERTEATLRPRSSSSSNSRRKSTGSRRKRADSWLVGEAGIGKTALVRQFERAVHEHGLKCWSGGAASVDTAVPYLAWRPVFAALLQGPDGAPAATTEALFGRPAAPKSWRRSINVVLPGFVEETEFVKNLSGDARADAISRVLSEVIGLAAPDPLILVLEDCHWMDSASWRLLVRVAQDHPSALLVLTTRPNLQLHELESLQRLEGFLELNLGPLRKDAVAQLVQEMLESDVVSPELIDDIAARSACNPLFVCEYTLLLESTKRRGQGESPRRSRSAWGAEAETLPATVEGLIASRLDGSTPSKTSCSRRRAYSATSFAPTCSTACTSARRTGRISERRSRASSAASC